MVEEAHAGAQEEVNQQRSAVAQADQRLQVEITNRGHAQRSLQIIAGRRDRLNQEREALPVPDHAEFEFKQETWLNCESASPRRRKNSSLNSRKYRSSSASAAR